MPKTPRNQKELFREQNQNFRGREAEGASNPAVNHPRESEGAGHSGNRKRR